MGSQLQGSGCTNHIARPSSQFFRAWLHLRPKLFSGQKHSNLKLLGRCCTSSRPATWRFTHALHLYIRLYGSIWPPVRKVPHVCRVVNSAQEQSTKMPANLGLVIVTAYHQIRKSTNLFGSFFPVGQAAISSANQLLLTAARAVGLSFTGIVSKLPQDCNGFKSSGDIQHMSNAERLIGAFEVSKTGRRQHPRTKVKTFQQPLAKCYPALSMGSRLIQ